MKQTILILLSFFLSINLFAQWERVVDYNVGSTGQVAVHGSTVFLYGFEKTQFVYRSTDNGNTWTNIANKFPDKVYYVHGHGSEVFAIVGINGIYSSVDDGVSWNSKSSIPFTDGAVLSLVSDGSTLYAVSNRNSVFKSTDNGVTWDKITINYSQAQVFGFDFAAAGDKMIFSALNLGSFVSIDAGKNWTLKNPKFMISSVNAFNNEFFGGTYGMYKFTGDTGWTSITSGFPNGIGVSASTRSLTSAGNKLFTCYTDVFAGSKIFVSEDDGNNWSEVGNNLTSASTTSLNDFIAATPNYLYYYIYSIFDPKSTGIFRYPIQTTTDVNQYNGNIPKRYSLKQNYPNPFNPTTSIQYAIGSRQFVTLKVYDILGDEVATLVNEVQTAGEYSVQFSTTNKLQTTNHTQLSSGIYFYQLSAGSFIQTKKLILMK